MKSEWHRSRTAVVTGASRGIGFAVCDGLVRAGWRVVVVARDPGRLAAARQRLDATVPGSVCNEWAVDLGCRAGVEQLASGLLRAGEPVDALVHNAGVICLQRALTTDGVERTWATNVVAPFVLTHRLLPLLPPVPATRVIFMSSLVHRWGRLHPDDPGLARGYTADEAYNQSKLALRLLAQAWAERRPGWLSLSMEPGMTATDFGADYTGWRALARSLYRPFMVSPERAADTAIWLAVADGAELRNGAHYKRRRVLNAGGDFGESAHAELAWSMLEKSLDAS